jgi:hypothetical protein
MKKITAVFCFINYTFGMFSKKKKETWLFKRQIKGLKRVLCTSYKKMLDTLLVSVDSIALNGSDMFTLTDNVDSPCYVLFKSV